MAMRVANGQEKGSVCVVLYKHGIHVMRRIVRNYVDSWQSNDDGTFMNLLIILSVKRNKCIFF